MKKRVLLFAFLFFVLGLTAQELEVAKFGTIDVVRTKNIVNLIFDGDTTKDGGMYYIFSKKLAKSNVKLREEHWACNDTCEIWAARCLKKIIKENEDVKEFLEQNAKENEDIGCYIYFDHEGNVLGMVFMLNEPYSERMRVPLEKMHKQWMAEKVNFATYWDFTKEHRHGMRMFNIMQLYRNIKLYWNLK